MRREQGVAFAPGPGGGVLEVDRMMWWSAHSRALRICPDTRRGPSTVVVYCSGALMPPFAATPPPAAAPKV